MNEKNEKLLEKIFGTESRNLYEGIGKVDPEALDLIENYALEKVWSRPGLPLRERSIITIASQVGMGRWDQVEIHMKSFLHMGGSIEDLREIAIHLSVYCGFPAMLSALRIVASLRSAACP